MTNMYFGIIIPKKKNGLGKNEMVGNEGWTGNSEALVRRGQVAERPQSSHVSYKSDRKIKVK